MKLSYYKQASFTVEASFLLPFILIIIFSFISFVFSLHDTVSTKALSYRFLLSHSMNDSDYICTYDDTVTKNFDTYAEQALIQRPVSIKKRFSHNHLSITTSLFSIPVTVSNYDKKNILLNTNQKR